MIKRILTCLREAYRDYRTFLDKDMQDEDEARNRGDYLQARIAGSCKMLDFLFFPVYVIREFIKNSRNSGLQSKLS